MLELGRRNKDNCAGARLVCKTRTGRRSGKTGALRCGCAALEAPALETAPLRIETMLLFIVPPWRWNARGSR
jgi:hypothetical protein